jgi:hypothetical protein
MPHPTTTRAYSFDTSAEAWAFMRAVDGTPGLAAGFPSLRAPYTVQVAGPEDAVLDLDAAYFAAAFAVAS